jgi:anaerobic ribonucleoside-triphosphate reductase activating protein
MILKYVPQDTSVTFSEVPSEISLCINISGCPCRCPGCHSRYLWEDVGEELTGLRLDSLIQENIGISCVVFMGGDLDPKYINYLAKCVKEHYPDLKVAWYSGRETVSPDIDLSNFNYIKVGPYREDCGPLTSSTTNQRMYMIDNQRIGKDITSKFRTNLCAQ